MPRLHAAGGSLHSAVYRVRQEVLRQSSSHDLGASPPCGLASTVGDVLSAMEHTWQGSKFSALSSKPKPRAGRKVSSVSRFIASCQATGEPQARELNSI